MRRNELPSGSPPGTPDPRESFTGQGTDPGSALLYYGARYYDPEVGRFIRPDPIVPALFDPQSLNRYAYVINDPLNRDDPTGNLFGSFGAALGSLGSTIGGFFGSVWGGIKNGFAAAWNAVSNSFHQAWKASSRFLASFTRHLLFLSVPVLRVANVVRTAAVAVRDALIPKPVTPQTTAVIPRARQHL